MKLSVYVTLSIGVAVASIWAGSKARVYLPDISPRLASLEEPSSGDAPQPQMVEVRIDTPERGAKRIAVAKYEVTFGDWQACVDAGGCTHQPKRRKYVRDDHPVTGVSWLDTQQYLAWLSHETGQTYRLPTETEWRVLADDVIEEKVDKLFDDPRMAWAADYANFGKRAGRRTQSIGLHGTEDNGVADIAGNVWEWTQSCWRRSAEGPKQEINKNCRGVRVLAGVHMTYQSELIRVVPTGGCSIGFPPANIGFRVVRDLASEPLLSNLLPTEDLKIRGKT
ncbi:hypothetical protein GCM10007094_34300 [Pseudovibrio japonicus]|uniref:Sulfatase-modifying factor enzyme-like domain-containing protein n=1 Tax=Pseudovibrio japonicus TaxID=366534 RepID=A0ABQ3EJE1_9HYPH|nr:SUMF1/EgtB/PvdO family nonheme iron enzyme [Pseudovibrio japonicus]GHB42230.1 hypothetical protein GCM10007094_34300 [Pseudovibrio japonicus]